MMSNGTPTGVAAIDTSTAHPARRYDYWLGGKDNFAADRESGDAIAAVFPSITTPPGRTARSCGARSPTSPPNSASASSST